MYKIDTLFLRRFLSHENTKFSPINGEINLIYGKNIDDVKDGADSNGSGKSGIIEGITFALSGETFRDINKDDYVMDGEKNGEVFLTLKNDIRKETLEIQRFFSKKDAQIVKIILNGKDLSSQFISVAAANEFILKKIGFSKEDLFTFFIINQENRDSFFTSNDSKQKEIISRFSNFDDIKKIYDSLHKECSLLEKQVNLYDRELLSVQSSLETLERMYESESEVDSEENVKNLLEEKENNITLLKEEIDLIQEELYVLNKEVKEKEENLKGVKLNIDECKSLLEAESELLSEKNNAEDKISRIKRNNKKFEAILSDLIKCPKCSHSFSLDTELSVEAMQEQIKMNLESMEFFTLKITKINESLEQFKEIKTLLSELKNEYSNLEEEKGDLEVDISSKTRRIKVKQNDISSIEESIVLLTKNGVKKDLSYLTSEIEDKKEKLKLTQEEKDLKSSELKQKQEICFHFSQKGFQTYLSNLCVKNVEFYVNSFLMKMGSNLSVVINGYKKLANGDIRDKIEIFINKNNKTKGKFSKYSGGQKERIKLAGVLCFHNLINSSTEFGGGLDLLVLDESLDHLDKTGQRNILNILKNFKGTIINITHGEAAQEIEGVNKFVVQMKDSVSSLI